LVRERIRKDQEREQHQHPNPEISFYERRHRRASKEFECFGRRL
jgi:hypothetical protein